MKGNQGPVLVDSQINRLLCHFYLHEISHFLFTGKDQDSHLMPTFIPELYVLLKHHVLY